MNLTKEQITQIAATIGLDYARLAAFIEVESGGSGFDPKTGKIIIQFEPHWMARYLTQFKIANTIVQIFDGQKKGWMLTAGGVTLQNGVEGQAAEWESFSTAFSKMHAKSALLSTSIGLMQVMGFNYSKLGYKSVDEMWDEFKKGEYQQVQGGANFIKNTPGLLNALKTKDWNTAAKLYNGGNYAAGKYHIKLANAYAKYSKL